LIGSNEWIALQQQSCLCQVHGVCMYNLCGSIFVQPVYFMTPISVAVWCGIAHYSTKPQLLLRWPRNVAQIEFSLSSAGYFSSMHSFSVLSQNIAIYWRKLDSFAYIFVADSMGLTSTMVT